MGLIAIARGCWKLKKFEVFFPPFPITQINTISHSHTHGHDPLALAIKSPIVVMLRSERANYPLISTLTRPSSYRHSQRMSLRNKFELLHTSKKEQKKKKDVHRRGDKLERIWSRKDHPSCTNCIFIFWWLTLWPLLTPNNRKRKMNKKASSLHKLHCTNCSSPQTTKFKSRTNRFPISHEVKRVSIQSKY
jgi:hypothetical protein